MSSTENSNNQAYAELLKNYWDEAPGKASDRELGNLEVLQGYRGQASKLDQSAITLSFVANEGLLLGGNFLAHGLKEQAWREFDKAQARAYLAYKIYWLAAWVPSAYSAPIFGFAQMCAFFSLAMARSDAEQATWYAQQIYNLRRGGLADQSCSAVEYVELHVAMAIAWLQREWPQKKDISNNLGPYAGLFMNETAAQKDCINVCADYHLNISIGLTEANGHPYTSRHVGHIAYELIGWAALKRRIDGLQLSGTSHPMAASYLFDLSPQEDFCDAILDDVEGLAKSIYADDWDAPATIFD